MIGAFAWTFCEYILHRFVGHSKSQFGSFTKEHRDHHRQDHSQNLPSYLSIDRTNIKAIVKRKADRREIYLDLNELLIVEFYSNRL